MHTSTSRQTLSRSVAASLPVVLLIALAGPPLWAQGRGQANRPDIAERARGAERVVVARVADVEPVTMTNEFGDQLIVSRTTLIIEETLKGRSIRRVTLDVEGGTLGDLTLTVSDMPTISTGERGVFFLQRATAGRSVPYGRGLGILKLTSANIVEHTTLDLETIRREVAASQP